MMSAEGCILTNPTSGMLLRMFSLLQRVERLSQLERTPRTYQKRSTQYWEHDLREKRANQKCRMDDERQENTNVNDSNLADAENMSPTEL